MNKTGFSDAFLRMAKDYANSMTEKENFKFACWGHQYNAIKPCFFNMRDGRIQVRFHNSKLAEKLEMKRIILTLEEYKLLPDGKLATKQLIKLSEAAK
jgi:hypothetical protein